MVAQSAQGQVRHPLLFVALLIGATVLNWLANTAHDVAAHPLNAAARFASEHRSLLEVLFGWLLIVV